MPFVIDDIIGIVGIAVAIPGLVQTFISASQYFSRKLRSRQDSAEVAEVNKLVVFIQRGTLRTTLETVEDLYCDPSTHEDVRKTLQNDASVLWVKLKELDQEIDILDDASRGEKEIKKAKKQVHEIVKSLYRLEEATRRSVQAQVQSRVVPSRLELRPGQLSIVGNLFSKLPRASILTCTGDFSTPNQRGVEHCVVEEITFPGLAPDRAKDQAVSLARKLQFTDEKHGLLSLAGFQVEHIPVFQPDLFRLFFTFPKGYASPRSLRDILLDPVNKPSPPIPRNFRFVLPRKLAGAVYHVHEQNLVHRCIRPESIVLFDLARYPPELKYPKTIGEPFLTDWRHVRRVIDSSKREAFYDWTMAMYQHPERQAEPFLFPGQTESAADAANRPKYHIGHDIYSLGVCLLEVGLWDSFVTYHPDGTTALSSVVADAKNSWKAANPADSQSMRESQIEQKAFIHLAGDRLAYEMGEGYSRLVVKCLTCVERGFGNVHTFVDSNSPDWEEQGFCFIQAVQQELTQASAMGQG